MKLKWPALLLCTVSLGTIPNVQAQAPAVYRCGNVYSQAPCPQAIAVDAVDSRTPEQRAEAQRLSAGELRRAADMRRERLAEQAALKPTAAASLSPAPPAPSASTAERKAPKRRHAAHKKNVDATFTARAPKHPAAPQH